MAGTGRRLRYGLRFRYFDDRGLECERRRFVDGLNSLQLPERWELHQRARRSNARMRLVEFGLMLGLASMVIVPALVVLTMKKPPGSLGQALIMAGGVLIMALLVLPFAACYGFLKRKNRNERVLELGRCPVCLYRLQSLSPESDGCTVCPECGAAWRLGPDVPEGS